MRMRALRSGTLIAILSLAVGMGVAWALSYRADDPDATSEAQSADRYPLVPVPFADGRKVSLRVTRGSSGKIVVHDGGIVTSRDCAPGAKWETADTPLTIDGRPRIVIASPDAFYRDLRGGEKGKDVVALQRMLASAGTSPGESGVFDVATRGALAVFMESRGVPQRAGITRGSFVLADVLWVPASPTVVENCEVMVGAPVSDGAAVASIVPEVTRISLPSMAGLQEGARQLSFDSAAIAFEGDSTEDAAKIAEILAVAEVQDVLKREAASSESVSIPAVYELREEITSYAVPPLAIGGLRGDHGCVSDGKKTYPARVLSSSLGLSYIVIDADTPPTSILLRAPKDLACG